MTISVRSAERESESGRVLEMLKTNLVAVPHDRRFQWLYRDNPDGPAWTWFAYEQGTNQVVGVASVFPRAMWVGGEVKICGQVGDFAIAATHRSLGPALMLQKATFEPVDCDNMAMCYDCPPHATAMATFRRLGFQPNCTIERYAMPLRVDKHLGRYIGSAAAPVAGAANLGLRAYHRLAARKGGFEIAEHEGPFGEEFSRLDEWCGNTNVIRVQRSARHLNWRYREDPLQHHAVLTARRKGELAGFVVFSDSGDTVRIEDLFGRELPETAVALLEAVVQRCGSSHHGIEAFLSTESPLVEAFLKARFYRRPVAAQVVAYTKQGSPTFSFVHQHPTWMFTGADVQA